MVSLNHLLACFDAAAAAAAAGNAEVLLENTPLHKAYGRINYGRIKIAQKKRKAPFLWLVRINLVMESAFPLS